MHGSTLYSVLVICFSILQKGTSGAYYGKFIGDITSRAHGFTGKMYAANARQVCITELNYDGKGPEAYFWIGKGPEGPSLASGNWTVDENNSSKILKAYKNACIVLTLPDKITDYGYIGMFCIKFRHNFGEVFIPDGFELPAEQKLGELRGSLHGVKASEVTLKDSATIELKGFYYDGTGPNARFAVGPTKDTPPDKLTMLLDENGKDAKLGGYSGKTVTIRLPKGQHWTDYQWFTVYCFAASVSFAGLEIPPEMSENLPVHDPSLVVQIPSPHVGDRSPDASKREGKKDFSEVIALLLGVALVAIIGAVFFFFLLQTSVKQRAKNADASHGDGGTGKTDVTKGTSSSVNPKK